MMSNIQVKFIDKPHIHEGKIYGNAEYRSLCSTHEMNFIYDLEQQKIEMIDEIAFGSWWDWDLEKMDDREQSIYNQILELLKEEGLI